MRYYHQRLGHWTYSIVDRSSRGSMGDVVALLVAGHPAVGYFKDGDFCFKRATDRIGSTWPRSPSIGFERVSRSSVPGEVSAALVGGLPAFAVPSQFSGSLLYRRMASPDSFDPAARVTRGASKMVSLNNVEEAVKAACLEIQTRFATPTDAVEGIEGGASACPTYNGCNDVSDFPGLHCNSTYGRSSSCSCNALQTTFEREVTLYPSELDTSSPAVHELNCRMVNIGTNYRDIASQYDLISLYSGFTSGVHKSWPARDWATKPNPTGCREVGECPQL